MSTTAFLTTREQALERLRHAGAAADPQLDLAEIALAFAALDRPEVELDDYRAHLADLSRDVGQIPIDEDEGIGARAEALRAVLFDGHGYHGDALTYDDLANANLMRVIDRRQGLPVALGILYIHAARGQGWAAAGLNFPGHFLIRLDYRGERAILDPFNGGRSLSASDLRDLLKAAGHAQAELLPEHYAPVGDRTVLIRLQNNIKLRLVEARKFERASEVLDAMLLLAPGEPGLWEEAGVISARLGNLGKAITSLNRVIELSPSRRQREHAAALIQKLKSTLH